MFSFNTLKMLLHYFLTCIYYNKKSAVFLSVFLCIQCFFVSQDSPLCNHLYMILWFIWFDET